MSAVDDRNARLDALTAAVQQWADQQQANITQRVTTAKAILQGRTGSERLAQAPVQAASALVVNQIDDFLVA